MIRQVNQYEAPTRGLATADLRISGSARDDVWSNSRIFRRAGGKNVPYVLYQDRQNKTKGSTQVNTVELLGKFLNLSWCCNPNLFNTQILRIKFRLKKFHVITSRTYYWCYLVAPFSTNWLSMQGSLDKVLWRTELVNPSTAVGWVDAPKTIQGQCCCADKLLR